MVFLGPPGERGGGNERGLSSGSLYKSRRVEKNETGRKNYIETVGLHWWN